MVSIDFQCPDVSNISIALPILQFCPNTFFNESVNMKAVKAIIIFVVLSVLTLTIFADEFTPLVYQYYTPEVTVEFAEGLNVSPERQQQIADDIAGISSSPMSGSPAMSPDNIICTIFGHDLSTTTVTATHHKVHVYNPRCLVEVYHVSACSRCNYTDAELVGSVYVFCCPED